MAVGKEIRNQIKSVKNTQKITRAMEMVAASKMRKAQDRMTASRPYAEKIRNVISHLAHAHPEYQHTYMQARDVKRVGYIIVSSDRGLCGGLNSNLFRSVVRELAQWSKKGIGIDLCTIGTKSTGYFSRLGSKVVANATQLGDAPQIEDLIGSVKVMLDLFESGDIDCLYVVYNKFVNTMTQVPTVDQLVPIEKSDDKELEHHWDYIYEPEAKDVLTELLTRYIESLVYQASVENVACEQAARMVAMKSASDNAGGMIDDLQLAYNKARQAAITQELSEIVSGAAAV
ncbi:MAG: F0F1 ATP synthase subunit gamma [Gammaproteobacteria bacterium]|nr:F0F1 ATP synthase subunit gamma [Gammaproteobacteria bacterium]